VRCSFTMCLAIRGRCGTSPPKDRAAHRHAHASRRGNPPSAVAALRPIVDAKPQVGRRFLCRG
jgi:hypothetical protein